MHSLFGDANAARFVWQKGLENLSRFRHNTIGIACADRSAKDLAIIGQGA
jgi:hypothetical protein